MFCTNCGKKLHDGDRFCGYCGTKVRVEEPKIKQEVVFNPPFKVEAERRTSEIFRGFAESAEEPEKPRRSEPAHFDWNLDGFPAEGTKKTEEVDFNWDSVLDRKREHKQEEERSISAIPVVDKIDIRETREAMSEHEYGKAPDEPSDAAEEETETFRWEPLNNQKQRAESAEIEPESRVEKEPEKEPAGRAEEEPRKEPRKEPEIQSLTSQAMAFILQNGVEKETETRPKADPSQGADAAELEKEFFDANYRGNAGTDPDERIKSTDQLEKFYTFNEKKEAFQELLDKEYERLRSMEEERKPDTESLEFTWAGKLFPQGGGVRDMQESGVQRMQENSAQSERQCADGMAVSEAVSEKEEHPESIGTEPAAATGTFVPADTIDFTPIRKEAKQRHQPDLMQEETSGAPAEKAAEAKEEPDPVEEAEAEEKQEREQEATDAPAAAPEQDGAPSGAVEPATNAENTENTENTENAKDAEPAENVDADEPAESTGITEPAGNGGISESGEDSSPSPSPEEKLQFRYSDVFPREGAASDSDGGSADPAGSAAQSGEAEQRKTGQNLTSIFDDEEEDESRGMHPFLKFIVIILVVLIVLEGIILAAKFIAPDSAFSVKANALVESILDLVTGGSGDADDKDPVEPAGSDDIQETYISAILRESVPKPDTIGSVEEDVDLKYDSAKTYAFGDALKAAEPFTDETWTTGKDGRTVTKAQVMMTELVSHYDQWKATNEDTSLIGINKLEIGEILTGEEGYYVLCRLTFAGEDGKDVVKYMTVNMKESQNSMIINEIKEETI